MTTAQRFFFFIILIGLVVAGVYIWQVTMPTPPPDSGVEGIVLIGPVRPEVRNQSSPYVPFAATIVVQDQDRVNDLMTVQSGEDGVFRVLLPPGNYWLNPVSPNPGVPPSASPLQVTVEPHRFTYVEIHYDTGLR